MMQREGNWLRQYGFPRQVIVMLTPTKFRIRHPELMIAINRFGRGINGFERVVLLNIFNSQYEQFANSKA